MQLRGQPPLIISGREGVVYFCSSFVSSFFAMAFVSRPILTRRRKFSIREDIISPLLRALECALAHSKGVRKIGR